MMPARTGLVSPQWRLYLREDPGADFCGVPASNAPSAASMARAPIRSQWLILFEMVCLDSAAICSGSIDRTLGSYQEQMDLREHLPNFCQRRPLGMVYSQRR